MKTIQWFTDSPDCGHPSCLCSWCGTVITEADAPAIRMFDTVQNLEARFHLACAGPVFGFEAYPAEQDLDAFDDMELP